MGEEVNEFNKSTSLLIRGRRSRKLKLPRRLHSSVQDLCGKWKNLSTDKVVKANCTSMGAIRTGDLSLNVNLSIVLTAGSGILECHGLDGGDWWCGSGGDGI